MDSRRSFVVPFSILAVALLAAPASIADEGEDLLVVLNGDLPYGHLVYLCKGDSFVRQTADFYADPIVGNETVDYASEVPCTEYQVAGLIGVRNGNQGDLHLRIKRPTQLLGVGGTPYVADPEQLVEQSTEWTSTCISTP
jgi:hypothetical protein